MSDQVDRRSFLGAGAAGLALTMAQSARSVAAQPNNRLLVGVMGTGGRGTGLATAFAAQPNVEIAYVCDADRTRAERAADAVNKAAGRAPKVLTDFRRILDDKTVDVMVVAACNHWHAPATILACAAGKHVYVEKPCSHTPREGEIMVEAARKHKRQVQMGNQRRTYPFVIEAIDQVRKGTIGRAYFAQAWYLANRGTIGQGKEANVPEGLDYALWQGPSTHRAFRTNYLHYNWHWFWHWGNGELGNNGIHTLDLCRWGLDVDYPIRVTSSGGRYRFQDDQETPDTHIVSYDFEGRKSITWEGLSCNLFPGANKPPMVVFFGDNGSLTLDDSGYSIVDRAGKELRRVPGKGNDAAHILNFLEAARGNGRPNSEIEEAHKSTLMCHLGNIAQRTHRTIHCQAKDGHIQNDKEAQAMWTKEYAKGWEPRA